MVFLFASVIWLTFLIAILILSENLRGYWVKIKDLNFKGEKNMTRFFFYFFSNESWCLSMAWKRRIEESNHFLLNVTHTLGTTPSGKSDRFPDVSRICPSSNSEYVDKPSRNFQIPLIHNHDVLDANALIDRNYKQGTSRRISFYPNIRTGSTLIPDAQVLVFYWWPFGAIISLVDSLWKLTLAFISWNRYVVFFSILRKFYYYYPVEK